MPKPAKGNKVKTINIDTVMVLGIQIGTYPAGAENIRVVYAGGYNDGNGNFVPVENYDMSFAGEDFAAIAADVPDGTETLFQAIERIVYARIDADSGV